MSTHTAVSENGIDSAEHKSQLCDPDDDEYALEGKCWHYGYIGEDEQGRHHHVDRKTDRIVVTEHAHDVDDSVSIPIYCVPGPVLHAEELANDDTLAAWIQFVDSECGGWKSRPVSAANQLQDVLTEGR